MSNRIKTLFILKLHLESEIKLLENKSIGEMSDDPVFDFFFSRYLLNNLKLKDYYVVKQRLLQDINSYLLENCQHVWDDDYIDINPERSMNITYCTLCCMSKN
jgi:hypothetical protein